MKWTQLDIFASLFEPKPAQEAPVPTPITPKVADPVPVTPSKLDWKTVMALPIMVLASCWDAMNDGHNPCRKCNREVCHDRNACLFLEAYRTGMEWRFGETSGETTAGIAEDGGHYSV